MYNFIHLQILWEIIYLFVKSGVMRLKTLKKYVFWKVNENGAGLQSDFFNTKNFKIQVPFFHRKFSKKIIGNLNHLRTAIFIL